MAALNETKDHYSVNHDEHHQLVKWDAPLRFFHWSLVVFFVVAFVSGEYDIEMVHNWFGYGLLLLLIFRLVWGFVGGRNARFRSFLYSPRETLRYLASCWHHRPIHYDSHNPAGALMVFTLLGLLLLLTCSGVLYEAWGEYQGPLWVLGLAMNDTVGAWSQRIHHQLPCWFLLLIPLHILGLLVATVQHKENFVRSMLTGYR